ncbi:galactofuranosyltransferase lpg1-like protein [Leptomonas pyrrhocoris]|uniref:Galactofuranosyltransferase lpg1-like protein n=1 Tax=Leptomonas pyrrhocoris TaxID=157538 RepID=A0A0M9GBA1_LEPPY|nr:galactofuranosyltransferase lpg1-like protein [Leptomonas pyrrhocoris]KPA86773.1 galactofuranosyltransferase lpg1-like protein [Leptomonas pyrrhocoris]|eukprot:XP_015665212.1 galactofuranosyltransferase lpg1-like protein [Leptomonas pyrrhocoris]
MHSSGVGGVGGGRRLLRRLMRPQQRRRRVLTVAAAGVLICFIVFILPLLFSAPKKIETQANGQRLPTLKSPTVLPDQTQATHAPALGDDGTRQRLPEPTEGKQGGGGADPQNRSTHAAARAGGFQELYALELKELEALDLFALRPGEQKVSFERFAGCLGTLLAVDPVDQTEVPRPSPANMQELPLMISVTAGNTQDLKAMICNLSVSYKYIVLAQTGDTPEMTPFFDLLTRAFRFTNRLVVLQFKNSIGFAGAVNAGLREALRHPFEEVPFVHIIHNDVRYVGTALADSIRDAYWDVRDDKAVIARLEAEVKTEPNNYTPLIRQPHGLRAPISPDGPLPQLSNNPNVLVTSALLPDRVRYMNSVDRKSEFHDRVGIAFHGSKGEYTAVYLSRLAVLTVGFFDENFYPALLDDTDFRWRAAMLGFTEMRLPDFDKSLVAFDGDCTSVRVDGEEEGRPALLIPVARRQAAAGGPNNGKAQLSPATKALLRECATAFYRSVQFSYMTTKWNVADFMALAGPMTSHQPYTLDAFSGKAHLPLDAWVVDTHRISVVKRSLRDTGAGGLKTEPYNPQVILEALR